MKINFTKKQYRVLLDLVCTGDWVINSFKDTDERSEEHEELLQYILSFADKFGFSDLVDYDRKLEEYYEKRELEDTVMEYLKEYDDYTFWDELASRLAQRDVYIELDGKEPERDEVLEKIWDTEDKYAQEFMENGLMNVMVKKG